MKKETPFLHSFLYFINNIDWYLDLCYFYYNLQTNELFGTCSLCQAILRGTVLKFRFQFMPYLISLRSTFYEITVEDPCGKKQQWRYQSKLFREYQQLSNSVFQKTLYCLNFWDNSLLSLFCWLYALPRFMGHYPTTLSQYASVVVDVTYLGDPVSFSLPDHPRIFA